MFIYVGYKIKPLVVIDINLPDFDSYCEKHKSKHEIVIAEKTKYVYFAPVHSAEKVYVYCKKCNSYDEMPEIFQKLFLSYYHNEISLKKLKHQFSIKAKKHKSLQNEKKEEYDKYFNDFLKWVPLIILFFILLLLIKYLFF